MNKLYFRNLIINGRMSIIHCIINRISQKIVQMTLNIWIIIKRSITIPFTNNIVNDLSNNRSFFDIMVHNLWINFYFYYYYSPKNFRFNEVMKHILISIEFEYTILMECLCYIIFILVS